MPSADQIATPAPENNWQDPLAASTAGFLAAPGAIPDVPIIPVMIDDKVLVRQDEAAKKIGNIILPDRSQAAPLLGTIIAMGPNKRASASRTQDEDLQVGDKVVFSNYVGVECSIERKPHVILRVSDLHYRLPREGEAGYEKIIKAENAPE